MSGRRTLWLLPLVALLVGGAAWAQQGPAAAEPPARLEGLSAALEDRTDDVVALALDKLFAEKRQAEEAIQEATPEKALEKARAEQTLGFVTQALTAHAGRLQELLKSQDSSVREDAARAFAAMGPAALPHADVLLPLLEDEDADIRESIAEAFAAMGPAAAPHAQRLAPLLKHADEDVQKAAAKALIRMGADPAQYFLPLLKDENEATRVKGLNALSVLGPAAAPYAGQLLALLKEVSQKASEETAAMSPEQQAQHKRRMYFRQEAMLPILLGNTLLDMGPAIAPQAPHFLPLLKARTWSIRYAALKAFHALGPAAAPYAPQLLPLLKDEDASVQDATLRAFIAMGPAAAPHAQALSPSLLHPQAGLRALAVEAFTAMGPAAVPTLLPLLQDKQELPRQMALEALTAMGPAAAAHAPRLLPLFRRDLRASFLEKPHTTRVPATKAFAAMGAGAVQALLPLLEKDHSDTQVAVAEAIAAIGPAATPHAPRLLPLLKARDVNVRAAAAEALAALGPEAAVYAPQLLPLLEDGWAARVSALLAFAAMGPQAAPHAPHLLPLLVDKDEDVRRGATKAFTAMGPAAAPHAQYLLPLLSRPEEEDRVAGAQAFAAMGPAAAPYAQHFLPLFTAQEVEVRQAAARLLGAMGPAAAPQAHLFQQLFKDEEAKVRTEALRAFTTLGPAVASQASFFTPLFKDPLPEIRNDSFGALSALGKEATPYLQHLLPVLGRMNLYEHSAAEEALEALTPVPFEFTAALIARAHDEPTSHPRWVLYAYLSSGGGREAQLLLRWLAKSSDARPMQLERDEARETLQAFARLWPLSEKSRRLRDDLAAQTASVAHLARAQWRPGEDTALLESLEKTLKDSHPKDAETVRSVIPPTEKPYLKYFGLLVLQPLFWLVLIFIYPRSPQVQALFFWTPWVRKVFGLWYVGLLLTWVPFLRRRLLAPFQSRLVDEAERDRAAPQHYFQGSEVLTPHSDAPLKLTQALPELQGLVILEGASGLGKTTFIRQLLARSKRPAVYLPAAACKEGVTEAIQAKLEGYASDATFLKSLIYSGGLDIYIDGLNEVTADTRARIVEFAVRNFRGNILLSTQPLEWKPPAAARLYKLQPLNGGLIEDFLLQHAPSGDKPSQQPEAYPAVCKRFVQEALSSKQPRELLDATYEVLANPMDLTVVAQMLAQGQTPDLFNLRQQQYELMAKDYRRVHLADFPLKEFAEAAYQMRLEDKAALPEERFGKELLRLEPVKMVVCLQWKGPDGKDYREWHFRHDKLQEFFIAQTFLGEDNLRPLEHMGDPRFRGVYFLLALTLELEKARELKDLLVEHAATTGDHSVSDGFVNLVKARSAAEKARPRRQKALA